MKETGLTGKRRSTSIAATPDDGKSQRKRRRECAHDRTNGWPFLPIPTLIIGLFVFSLATLLHVHWGKATFVYNIKVRQTGPEQVLIIFCIRSRGYTHFGNLIKHFIFSARALIWLVCLSRCLPCQCQLIAGLTRVNSHISILK